jgi:lipoprotein signal peptidase
MTKLSMSPVTFFVVVAVSAVILEKWSNLVIKRAMQPYYKELFESYNVVETKNKVS